MLPDGKLYVPGAEKLIPNLSRLVEAARQGKVFLISSADAHNPNDSEFRVWPPHCLKGTAGAELLPEARAESRCVIPNEKGFILPSDLDSYQQVTLLKNTLDVFDNPHTDALLARRNPESPPQFDAHAEFIVFGVVTEYCVRCTAEGLLQRHRPLAMVTDAIQSLSEDEGRAILKRLLERGARFITTEEALTLVSRGLQL